MIKIIIENHFIIIEGLLVRYFLRETFGGIKIYTYLCKKGEGCRRY